VRRPSRKRIDGLGFRGGRFLPPGRGRKLPLRWKARAMKFRHSLRAVAALSLLLVSVRAESPIGFRQLGSTTPVAVQRGQKSTINIRSNFTLDGAYKVLFDRPGISMVLLETEPIAAVHKGRGTPGTPFRFEADVPGNQPLGLYELRVASKTAVSSATHLLVTDYPVVNEEKTENGTLATAQKVSFPVAICGMCERAEDVDYYEISGSTGQEITFNVYAQRVTEAVHSMQSGGGGGSVIYLMDAILTLYDSRGQVVAQNDNFFGGDSFFAYKFPEDGDYLLEVRDARYVGNEKYVYCIEITDKPFAHAVFPMAIQRGMANEAGVIGHNLAGLQKTKLSSMDQDVCGWRDISIETPVGQTNPVQLLISPFPQLVTPNGNYSISNAMPLELPVGVSGRFSEPGQVHFYSFDAIADRYYLFEIESDRRNLALDSIICIHDSAGNQIAEADDGQQTKDATLYFKAPSDDKFFISVRDLHDRAGERFLYYLRAEPSGPDFEVHGRYYYALIAPGTRMIWFARINRLNGFTGPVEMQIEGLPEGVSFTPVTIPTGMDHCALILESQPDAKVDASLVRVFGKAEIPDLDGTPREIVRYGRVTCELQASGGAQNNWLINTQIVGVTDPLDLDKLDATPSEITLRPGEKVEIAVRVQRNEKFTGPITLAMAYMYSTSVLSDQLPPGVTVSTESKAHLTSDVSEGTIVLEAATGEEAPKPVERFPIAVMAQVAISFSISTNYASNPIYLTIPHSDVEKD